MEKSNQQITGKTRLDQEMESLLAERQKLVTSFVHAVTEKRPSKMTRMFQRLRHTNEFLNRLE